MYDTIVIGGGPAGLQAALTLGRMHRSVLMLDSGAYRNATVEHMQNFITHDGRDPAEMRGLARKDIAAYATVEIRDAAVDAVRRTDDGFEVVAGDEAHATRSVVLATGVRDMLPDIPGIAEAWGREIAHCPFCHGHEFAGRRVALLGAGPQTSHLAGMLAGIVGELVALADGEPLEPDVAGRLDGLGVPVRANSVVAVERTAPGLRILLSGGESLDVDGMFVATQMSQAAPFAEQLGLALLPSGSVEIDPMGRTSVPGVYAAGDMAHVAALPGPMASVMNAAAAGLVAASVCHMELSMHA